MHHGLHHAQAMHVLPIPPRIARTAPSAIAATTPAPPSDRLTGILRLYDRRDTNRILIRSGAFDGWLDDLEAGKADPPRLVDNHDWRGPGNHIVGAITHLRDTKRRMRIVAQWADSSYARELKGLVRGGFIHGLSPGWRTLRYEIVEEGLDVIEASLVEATVTAFPAERLCRIDL